MSGHDLPLKDTELPEALSAAMVDLNDRFYGHDRTTGTTYINDNVVLCIGAEDEFTATIERLTGRSVIAFLGSNQTSTGVASELFFLEPLPVLAA